MQLAKKPLNKIDFDDIENIKVTASKKVLMKGQEVLGLFSKESNIKYQDILIALGLSKGKYSRDIEEKCIEYLMIENQSDKDTFLAINSNLNEKLIKEVIEYKENLVKELNDVPAKLINFVVESASKEAIFNEILETLNLATDEEVSMETLENTDVVIIAELLIRIVKKPKVSMEKALFLNSFIMGIKNTFQSLNIIMPVKNLISKEN